MPLTPEQSRDLIVNYLRSRTNDFQEWCVKTLGQTCNVTGAVDTESGTSVPVVKINPVTPLDA